MKKNSGKDTLQKSSGTQFTAVKLVRGISRAIDYIVMAVFLLMLLIGCYALWDTNQLVQEASTTQFEVYKPTADSSMTFEQLKQENKEVFSWVTVYGTNIDYPVTQGKDNNKYINTDARGNFSLTGSIYLDYRNSNKFKDFNSIIYGHHMEQSVMFGDLDKFLQEDFFHTRKHGNLYYNGKNYGLEFFAFLEADAYDWDIYKPGIKGANKQSAYLKNILSKAKFSREIGVSEKDKIVLLSTCASDTTNGRYILAARISDKVFENTFSEDNGQSSTGKISLFTIFFGVPLWGWFVLFILILLIIIYLWHKNRKKDKDSQNNKKAVFD